MEIIIESDDDYKSDAKLLDEIVAKYGQQIADELEYEMFADTGSVGKAQLVSDPQGEYQESQVTGSALKGAWFTEAIYQDEEGSPVIANYFKLDETTYFMFYCRQ